MMVGHAALAFALAALAATHIDIDPREALLFGAVAGAFAVVPDVDIGYAVVGLVTTDGVALSSLPDVFWETGNTVHRGLTHSFVIAVVAAVLFGLAVQPGYRRLLAAAGVVGVVATAARLADPLEAGVLLSFLTAGVAAAVVARRVGLWPRTVFAAAVVGLLSHPFGDVFTGTSPTLLYPLDVSLLPERVLLSADPTLHLLGAFGTELATVWLAVVVFFRLRDRPLWAAVRPRALVGAGYAGTLVTLPLPTLAVSYQFVLGVLALGTAVALAGLPGADPRCRRTRDSLFVTGLSTVTAGWLAYSVAYLLIG